MPIHTSCSDIENEVLIDLYVNQGCPQKVVADIFGVCVKTIRNELVELDILRSKSEVVKLNWENGQKYNHRKSGFKKGNEHLQWNGGRFYDSKGYVLVYVPNCNFPTQGKYVLEHRLVWFSQHPETPKDWIIHHLNGIRDDNRIENLFACSRTKHIKQFPNTYIRALQKRIRELESD